MNYQTVFENELEKIGKLNYKPKLLLHACCAPCSSYVIEYLHEYFEITVFFYNPNIYPVTEYERRLNELIKFLKEFKYDQKINIIHEKYSHFEFANCASGFEAVKEGGERCFKCYELRLSKTAEKAKELEYDYFTTTLTISPHKNSEKINEIGKKLSDIYGVKFLYSDFKKKNGFKRSLELSEEYGLYRQNYCGCEYSMNDRYQE
ncbi:MAG: epoxyqueuosine reductase QueH [Candidatus Delongbacteria bacterium]|nr:epoxyqueuosine reductase QueH [Candidatus Delongbacteria bacterium]MCG2759877.1 epoxyqueuosine reductase QueH [Candidatus Delongbacteria bacterium]